MYIPSHLCRINRTRQSVATPITVDTDHIKKKDVVNEQSKRKTFPADQRVRLSKTFSLSEIRKREDPLPPLYTPLRGVQEKGKKGGI